MRSYSQQNVLTLPTHMHVFRIRYSTYLYVHLYHRKQLYYLYIMKTVGNILQHWMCKLYVYIPYTILILKLRNKWFSNKHSHENCINFTAHFLLCTLARTVTHIPKTHIHLCTKEKLYTQIFIYIYVHIT